MHRRFRILLSHLYFPPAGKPYGLMLRYIAERLAQEGHDVSIFASCDPREQDRTDAVARELAATGITITRVPIGTGAGTGAKLSGALRYVWALSRHMVKTRPEIVTVASFPPLFAAFAVAITGRIIGSKVIYHVQDIHPDITAPKLPRFLRPFYRLAGAVMNAATLRMIRGAVTLSPDMRDILVKRGAPPERTICLNNLSLSSLQALPRKAPPARPHGALRKPFNVVFAGNMGAFQALDRVSAFVRAASAIPDIEFTFIGDGVRRDWLKHELAHLGPDKVHFKPFMPFSDLAPILEQAQMGLVSLDDASVRYAYPSKIPTYLAMGLPLLCIFDRSNALAREVDKNGLGIVCDETSHTEALVKLAELATSPRLQMEMKKNVQSHFKAGFSANQYIQRLNSYIQSIGQS